jgi:hypothetical protein
MEAKNEEERRSRDVESQQARVRPCERTGWDERTRGEEDHRLRRRGAKQAELEGGEEEEVTVVRTASKRIG